MVDQTDIARSGPGDTHHGTRPLRRALGILVLGEELLDGLDRCCGYRMSMISHGTRTSRAPAKSKEEFGAKEWNNITNYTDKRPYMCIDTNLYSERGHLPRRCRCLSRTCKLRTTV